MRRVRSRSWPAALVGLVAVMTCAGGAEGVAQDPAGEESVRLEVDRLPVEIRPDLLREPSLVWDGRVVSLDRADFLDLLDANEISPSAADALAAALLPRSDPGAFDYLFRKMQPIVPDVVGDALGEFILKIEAVCRRKLGAEAQRCRNELDAYRQWQAGATAAAAACSFKVVGNYRHAADVHGGAKVYQAEYRAFDEACMAGPTPWPRPGLGVGMDREPVAFRRERAADGSAGALAATGLIQVWNKTDGEWEHLCAGLLLRPARPGGPVRILTALHCFAKAAPALADGEVRVARAIGPDDTYRLAPTPVLGGSVLGANPSAIAEDYVLLELVGAPSDMPLPAVEFRGPTAPVDVVAVSYFIHHDEERAKHDPLAAGGVASRRPWWQRGLRWARPGMCQALPADRDCVRLFCQTTYGFSGAPVFASNQTEDGPLVVHGLISFPASSREGQPDCTAPLLGSAQGFSASSETMVSANLMSTLAVLPDNAIITGSH